MIPVTSVLRGAAGHEIHAAPPGTPMKVALVRSGVTLSHFHAASGPDAGRPEEWEEPKGRADDPHQANPGFET
jgi:hypothetical protein